MCPTSLALKSSRKEVTAGTRMIVPLGLEILLRDPGGPDKGYFFKAKLGNLLVVRPLGYNPGTREFRV